MAVRESGAIVQFMTLVEEYTPIKPVVGRGNTFEEAMFYCGLFGLTQEQVLFLVGLGVAYALLVVGIK